MEEITLSVKITPKSQRAEIAGKLSDGTIKIRLTSAPEKGKANKELIKFLASEYKVPQNNIIITNGLTSSRKTIKITTR